MNDVNYVLDELANFINCNEDAIVSGKLHPTLMSNWIRGFIVGMRCATDHGINCGCKCDECCVEEDE